MKKIIKTILLMIGLSGCAQSDSCNLNSDIDFIHQTLLENHPGVYNKLDPDFKKLLDNNYLTAKRDLQNTTNLEKQKEIISLFAKKFNDSHLRIHWYDQDKKHEAFKNYRFRADFSDSKIAWITLPTFCFDDKAKKNFPAFLKSLNKARNKKIIVFDIRENRGGNSVYGNKIIKAIFGKKYIESKLDHANRKLFIDWRATKGNLVHLENLYEDLNKPSWLKDVIDGVELSIREGRPYYREHTTQPKEGKTPIKPSFPQIYVITDSVNVSAALDFIDTLKIANLNPILLGKKTNADRLYIEVRETTLPSGLGSLTFPIKVYRNRLRQDNKPYIPDIKCDIQSTDFIKSLIKERES